MKGLMSLWTDTTKFQLHREVAVIQTLAICMAGRFFDNTELVTDSRGIEIADRLGWRFTAYTNALNYLCPEGMKHIWALGKLYAISMQEEAFCHIDNDVILHKPLPVMVQFAKIFAQSKDIPRYYNGEEIKKALAVSGLSRSAIAYNMGIVGGIDHPTLRRYACEAIEGAFKFNNSPINGTAISMVVEQYKLGDFTRREKIRVEELIPMDYTEREVEDVGYTHLIGQTKRLQKWAWKAEVRLANEFPDAHKAFTAGWPVVVKRHG